jgi:prevent-host-death family protein
MGADEKVTVLFDWPKIATCFTIYVNVQASNRSAANSPVKPSAHVGPARMVLAVPDEPARGRKPVLRDELAVVVAKQQYPHERLPIYIMKAKTIAASKFKEQCLQLLDTVDQDGIIITKHGKPVARLLPISTTETDEDLIGILSGQVQIKGDILNTGLKWNAES